MHMVWAAVITGFIAGVVHVFSGPDHLAAVAPLSVAKANCASRTGLEGGLGHCAGVALIGFLALVFREMFSLESVSFWAEKFVGLMLVGIGAWGICRGASRQLQAPRSAPFAIGTVHGLAGSSHLIGVLPA